MLSTWEKQIDDHIVPGQTDFVHLHGAAKEVTAASLQQYDVRPTVIRDGVYLIISSGNPYNLLDGRYGSPVLDDPPKYPNGSQKDQD